MATQTIIAQYTPNLPTSWESQKDLNRQECHLGLTRTFKDNFFKTGHALFTIPQS